MTKMYLKAKLEDKHNILRLGGIFYSGKKISFKNVIFLHLAIVIFDIPEIPISFSKTPVLEIVFFFLFDCTYDWIMKFVVLAKLSSLLGIFFCQHKKTLPAYQI